VKRNLLLAEHLHEDLAPARLIELDEEQALPDAQPQRTVSNGNRFRCIEDEALAVQCPSRLSFSFMFTVRTSKSLWPYSWSGSQPVEK
jgi:hypothetical protein